MPIFEAGLWNVWILSLPFIALAVLGFVKRPEVAKRMSDMTGYSSKEKFFTMSASLAPYPLLIATVWASFTGNAVLLAIGLALFLAGMVLFASTLMVIIDTPLNEPFRSGPYRISRNPLYVGATLVFAGICMVSANVLFAVYLVFAVLMQHFMIVAEVRVCRRKYGQDFEAYLQRVPRYLFRLPNHRFRADR